MMLLLFLFLARDRAVPVRSLALPVDGKPVHLQCPVGLRTRLVFPEPLLLLKASSGAGALLGIEATESRPFGVVSLTPTRSGRGTLEIRGTTIVLTLVLEAVPGGETSQIQWVRQEESSRPESPRPESSRPESPRPESPRPASARPEPPVPPSAPESVVSMGPEPATSPFGQSPAPSPAPIPGASPDPEPRASAEPASAPLMKPVDPILLALRCTTIGRREGLPGQPVLVLEDILESGDEGFVRFTLEKGREAHVQRVMGPSGEIQGVFEEAFGADLRVVVPIRREVLHGRPRIAITFRGGGTYDFALTGPTLVNFLKGIFR